MLRLSERPVGRLVHLLIESRRRPSQFTGLTGIWIRRFTKSALCEQSSRNSLDSILSDWPGPYRLAINSIARDISEDKACEGEAKSRHIDQRNWLAFISSFRRQLVKDPLAVVGGRERLVELCRLLDGVGDIDVTTIRQDDRDRDRDVTTPARPAPTSSATIVNSSKSNEEERNRELCKQFLFNHMIAEAETSLADAIAAYKTLCETSDLRIPHEWYPYARLMKRKIIYHGGPTNSGKTYHALQRLKSADPKKGGGLYCGPLRLLALEVYESLNKSGVYTDLLTGQERREVPFATHISSTVEMVNINREYDVAVIDEIQMISNSQRGSAWTRALLGLRAKEIHVCGGIEAAEVVEKLVTSAGDDFELKAYQRLSTLQINDVSLRGDYSKIQPGDCIVAFSRADIFSIRRQVERLTPYKCAIIYGQLPPETRSTQARLFNEEGTGYDVLVASDAIGMGLNLNIKRVVFHTTIKKDAGKKVYWVDPSSVKQIAGRAGRLSSNYKIGEVTAWQDADLAYVKSVMSWEIPQIPAAGIFPSVEQIELFSQQLQKASEASSTNTDGADTDDADADTDDVVRDGSKPDSMKADDKQQGERVASDTASSSSTSSSSSSSSSNAVRNAAEHMRLSSLFERFVELSRVEGRYFLCDHEDMVTISNWLHSVPLTLAERFTFANAPVNIRDTLSMNMVYQFAASYAMKRPVALNLRLSRHKPRDVFEFSELCFKHNVLDLYLWLALRFPEYFIDKEACLEQKSHAISMIESSLDLPSLQQQFSHSQEYKNVRQNLLAATPDALPPLEFGEVRQKCREQLAKMDEKYMYVFPHMELEERLARVTRDTHRGEARRHEKHDRYEKHEKSGHQGNKKAHSHPHTPRAHGDVEIKHSTRQ